MSTRERKRIRDDRPADTQPEDGGSHDELNALRQRAGDLINEADEAMVKSMSTDSDRFIKEAQQNIGQ